MADSKSKIIRVDDNLDNYQGFYDHQWSKDLLALSDKSKLSEACFDLMVTWKGLSDATRLPWLMIEAVTAGIQGCMDNTIPFPNQVLQSLLDRVITGVEKNKRCLKGVRSAVDLIETTFPPCVPDASVSSLYLSSPSSLNKLKSLRILLYYDTFTFTWHLISRYGPEQRRTENLPR